MTKEKMTVHQALSELKLLDSRIYKKIQELSPCVANRKSNKKIKGVDVEEFKRNGKEDYQSITSMIKRRAALKRAVALSNATTMVKINDNEISIVEAIEMKNHGMELWKELLNRIEHFYQNEVKTCDLSNMGLDEKATDYVAKTFNGGDKNIKTSDLQEKINDFIESNTHSIVEGINCREEINKLSDYIMEFTSKVDSQLSISNALTEIEIEY